MPNKLKYNATGTEANSIFKGNWAINTSPPNTGGGPSSITGFYNGAEVPEGGYVLYLESGAYTLNNDAELIAYANSLGAGTETLAGALDWLADQNTMLVVDRDAEDIVTDQLVMHIDPANLVCYPRSGNAIKDLSGSGTTLSGTGTSSSARSSAEGFILDSDGDMFNVSLGADVRYSATLEAWIFPAAAEITGGDRGTIMVNGIYMSWNKSNSKLSSYWYGKSPAGYHEPSSPVTRETWHHFVSIWDYDASKFYQWVDGSLVKDITVTGAGNLVTTLRLGRESSARQFSGAFGPMRVYNKALSAEEVLHNWNAQKSRFGY